MRGSPHRVLLRLATPQTRLLIIKSAGTCEVFLIRGKEHYYVNDALFRLLLAHEWITQPRALDPEGTLLEGYLTPAGYQLAEEIEAQRSNYAQLQLWEQRASEPQPQLQETGVS